MAAEPEVVSIRSDGLDLYGRLRHSADEAPTLLLLPGLGFHTFEYEPLAALLGVLGLNCLSLDYRGHGRSGGARGAWLLSDLVADARHAIGFVRARYPGPIALFGNSLGAMVGILAGAVDDRVVAVAAANCPARTGDFLLTRPRRALFALGKLVAPLVPLRISVNHFYSYEQLIDDRFWVSTFQRDPLITDARRLSIPTYETLLERWDGRSAVADLHKPLLLIQGANDQMQPPQQSRLVFDAANDPKEYRTVDTGHLPHLEDSDTLGALLAEWLCPWLEGHGRRL